MRLLFELEGVAEDFRVGADLRLIDSGALREPSLVIHGVGFVVGHHQATVVRVVVDEIDDPREAYREGREVSTNRSTAKRIWGEEIDDKQLMLRTMKGEFHKKTAMSVKLPKPKKTAEEKAAEKRSEEVFAAAAKRAEKSNRVMTREEYDALWHPPHVYNPPEE